MAKKDENNFENLLKRLEEIVKKLEIGDLPLEDSLKIFEEGVSLIRICTKKLNEVEKKVEILLKDRNGNIVKEPFELDKKNINE